jgi:hypothetical protein
LRVPGFGLIEHLANAINRVLDFVHVAGFLTLDHDNCRDHAVSGRNVEKKNAVFLRGYKDRRRGYAFLELHEGSISLLGPYELL